VLLISPSRPLHTTVLSTSVLGIGPLPSLLALSDRTEKSPDRGWLDTPPPCPTPVHRFCADFFFTANRFSFFSGPRRESRIPRLCIAVRDLFAPRRLPLFSLTLCVFRQTLHRYLALAFVRTTCRFFSLQNPFFPRPPTLRKTGFGDCVQHASYNTSPLPSSHVFVRGGRLGVLYVPSFPWLFIGRGTS